MNRPMLHACRIVAVSAAWLFLSTAQAQRPAAIVADRIVTPDGTLVSGSAIEITNGKIGNLIPLARLAPSANVDRYPGAVICPGLIDLRSTLGAYGNNDETALAIDPAASAVDVIDPNHRDFRTALQAGVTAALITPKNNNLVSGATVVVKTASADGSGAAIIRAEGPLAFAMGPSVWQPSRAPTSQIGAISMLREAVAGAQNGRGHERMQLFVRGDLPAIVVCDRPMDVTAALSVLGASGGFFAVVHSSGELELAADLSGAGVPVVVGPYTTSTPIRTIRQAGVFSTAGVPVAFSGGLPARPADSIRITASLAVRHGMSAAAARKAMTVTAAGVAGAADRIGSISTGLDADLVVFSGDPLRLDSRVLAVYVDGVRVYRSDGE